MDRPATARMLGRRSMKIKRLGNAYCAVRILGTPPGDLLPVSETTFTAYLHSALKIQDQMLVVNGSCNMSWTDGNRISSKYSGTPALRPVHF